MNSLKRKLQKDKKVPQVFCVSREATLIGSYEITSQEDLDKLKEDRRNLAGLFVPHLVSISTPSRWPLVIKANIYSVVGIRRLETDDCT